MKDPVLKGGIFAAGIACGFLLSLTFINKNNRVTQSAAVSVTERQPDSVLPAIAEPAKDFLPAPVFKIQGKLSSDVNGQVYLRYTESTGADQYEIKVADPEGNVAKTFTSKRTVFMVKGLYVDPKNKSTPYKVQVIPIGAGGERGTASEWREVAMLPMRNLAPPTIKSITTEE